MEYSMLLSPWRPLIASLFVMLFCCGTANAQRNPYDPRSYITEARIRDTHEAIRHVLKTEKSPISLSDAREIVIRGTLSALALRCNLPWEERIFIPMMARYRHSRKLSEPLMTVIGIMHGFQQGTVLKEVPEGSCSQRIRDQMLKAMTN